MRDFRTIRSWLFVPGDSERKIARCYESGADAIIFDLEDAVMPENKAAARALTAAAVRDARARGERRALVIRLNALATGMLADDIAATVAARPDAYVVPKVADERDVAAVARILAEAEAEVGAEGPAGLIPIATELPGAIFRLREIAGAPRVVALMWGMEDLGAEIGARRTRALDGRILEPFRVVRTLTMFAAASAGVGSIDTPSVDLGNHELLAEEATEASWCGFTGKAAIHPAQVPAINAAFTPSPEEQAEAREILRLSEAGGGAAFRHNGRMVDTPHLVAARRLLARLG